MKRKPFPGKNLFVRSAFISTYRKTTIKAAVILRERSDPKDLRTEFV
jgi:hypothetical protein